MSKPGFYAVRAGRQPGIYASWPEAEHQIKGFRGAVFKKFKKVEDATEFLAVVGPGDFYEKKGGGPAPSTSAAAKVPNITDKRPNTTDEEEDASTSKGKKRRKNNDLQEGQPDGGSSGAQVSRRVYCDGSCLGNGKKGSKAGIGIWWSHAETALNVSERLPGSKQTNQRAEMYAVARILEDDPTPHVPLMICTDSMYTIKEWAVKWKLNGWKTSSGEDVVNRDLIRYVLSLIALRSPPNSTQTFANICFEKVTAHVGIEGNEQADILAKKGAEMDQLLERDFEVAAKKNVKLLKERNTIVGLPTAIIEASDLISEEELSSLERTQEF